MKSVGVRELKNRLSEYLRQVRTGASVLVTDRGEVVAELLPPGQGQTDSALPPGLVSLAKRGLVTLGNVNEPALYPALPLPRRPRRRSATQMLDDERGPR